MSVISTSELLSAYALTFTIFGAISIGSIIVIAIITGVIDIWNK